jgi:hypothetical protein
MSGFVYAVECAGRIKIGFSEGPEKRFNKIASDAPFPCVLLGYWPATVADEMAFHERFKSIRVHGEWFAVTEDLLAFVSANVIPAENMGVRFRVSEDDSILAAWRKSNKKLGAEVADELGITQATWSRWESKSRRVPAERVADVERVTGINRAELRPDIFGASK